MAFFGYDEFKFASDYIASKTSYTPRVGMVMGSGLGDFAELVEQADIIPYADVPNFPVSTVQGHVGQFHIGTLFNHSVMVMRGRSHYYEGYPPSQLTLPIRVMQLLGVEIVVLTNAAGGINKDFEAGDLMLITDHINFLGLAGGNPLIGPNDERLGPRFPDTSKVYDRDLRSLAVNVAKKENIPLRRGVYAYLSGPTFESPAEVRMLRVLGADAVGMSTVPEAVVARHGGMRVLGISMISNITIDTLDSGEETTHEEVLSTGEITIPRLQSLLEGVLNQLA